MLGCIVRGGARLLDSYLLLFSFCMGFAPGLYGNGTYAMRTRARLDAGCKRFHRCWYSLEALHVTSLVSLFSFDHPLM